MSWAINYPALTATLAKHDPSKPIYMLNMWKYRAEAKYLPEHASFAGTQPISGREAAALYRQSLTPLLPPNCAIFLHGAALTSLVAPTGETWDDIVVVRYETADGFRQMVESEGYRRDALPHRQAAFEDCRLVMLRMPEDMGGEGEGK